MRDRCQAPPLHRHGRPGRAREVMQGERIVLHPPRPFGRELHPIRKRQPLPCGSRTVGGQASVPSVEPAWDDACGRAGLIGRRCPPVHHRIEHPIGVRTDVRSLVAHRMGVPAGPRVTACDAEKAAIPGHQRPGLHVCDQAQGRCREHPASTAHAPMGADAHHTRRRSGLPPRFCSPQPGHAQRRSKRPSWSRVRASAAQTAGAHGARQCSLKSGPDASAAIRSHGHRAMAAPWWRCVVRR